MKPNKYRNVKVKSKDGTFDSQAEYARWCQLQLLEKAGKLQELDRQERFLLRAYSPENREIGEAIGYYVADFVYYLPDGTMVVEDVKGVETTLFKWKRKHFEAQYGTPITLIKPR